MNTKHQRTLERIFTTPTLKNLAWRDLENLFVAIGCEVSEGAGSRVAFVHGTLRIDFHRPHPTKEAKPYQIRDAREFLTMLELVPVVLEQEEK